jgi:hypothetical protein
MVVEAIIIALALYWGLTSIGDGLESVALNIEQFGNQIEALFSDEVEEE